MQPYLDSTTERQRQEIARNRTLLEELKRRKLEARETDRGVVVNPCFTTSGHRVPGCH